MEKTIFDDLRSAGETVANLAKTAGLSRPTFYRAFVPGAEVTMDTITRLADTLGTPMPKMLTAAQRTEALSRFIAKRARK